MAEVTPGGIVPEENLDAMIGGLGDPVFQTQRLFRSIMDAMARPGTIHAMKTDAQPPASIYPLTAAVLATLADADTPIWLEGRLSDNRTLTSWLTFHIGAPFAPEPDAASFAVLKGWQGDARFGRFCQGYAGLSRSVRHTDHRGGSLVRHAEMVPVRPRNQGAERPDGFRPCSLVLVPMARQSGALSTWGRYHIRIS